jgi:dynein heavy chain
MRNALAGKHSRIANDEIELIAKVARQRTKEELEKFEAMHRKIETAPKDIEELTGIREYMASVPKEIEKEKVEITSIM